MITPEVKVTNLPTSGVGAPSGALYIAQRKITPSSSFFRPNDTTAYASNDLIANSTTAAQVVPLQWLVTPTFGGVVVIRRARAWKSQATAWASSQLFLFTAPPTFGAGDNSAPAEIGSANYVGSITLSVNRTAGDGAIALSADSIMTVQCAAISQSLYGFIVASGAYTPAANEQFIVTLDVWPD